MRQNVKFSTRITLILNTHANSYVDSSVVVFIDWLGTFDLHRAFWFIWFITSILSAIWQRDTVELRLVCERMLRFNNRRKFKTFKAEKGERWRWANWEHTKLRRGHTLLLSRRASCFSAMLLLLLELSSSTRTQWDSSLQRTYGGRLADATIQTSKAWETFSRAT